MLSIIIVNYKSEQHLINCLNSIFKQTSNIDFEVMVVDNSTSGIDAMRALAAFPLVRRIPMNYNAGFARANNEGIRQAVGEIILLLNPDTLVEDNAIEKVYVDFLNSSCIACGVQLLNPDHTKQISGNYAMKGGLNYLLPLPYTGWLVKKLGELFKVKKPHVEDAKGVVEVDWINGAFLMVKKSAFQIAGLMDEDFFLYAEEAEWCSRLKKAGTLCIFGKYHVVHLQGESANEAFGSAGKGYYNLYDNKGRQLLVSNLVRIRKQFGIGWFFFHLVAATFTIPVFFIVGFVHRLFTLRNPFSHFSQAGNFASNVFYVWRLVPVIISRKPYFYKV